MSNLIDLTKLLPTGSHALIGAHVVPFSGDSRHRSVGYDQASPQVITRQMAMMREIGITFVTLDWYGTHDRSQQVLMGWMDACERDGKFKFAVMADGQADVMNIMHVYESPAYLDRLLLTFPAGWTSAIPTGMKWLRHGASGGFLWMELPKAGTLDTPVTILKRQYAMRPTMGVVFSGFNDSDPLKPASSVWGGAARRWDDATGETWRASWQALPPDVKYVQVCTWNDAEEGTSCEGWVMKLTGGTL